ncbi:TolC family protein [Hymenobacter weizhouensis]|uniref:TolC family protein n=1 Tax=Hymenobacter sp. YIM 151500-1 TaxID=2987689 RepID=UPI002226F21E|nr:TolC family protein [Hymenobacter sp. YIM 151500-1]UYZ61776.1 TolC family protein [Hymenobacter sp. YIM 151500-1]
MFFLSVMMSLPLAAVGQGSSAAPSAPAAPQELSLAQAIELAKTSQGTYRNLTLDQQIAAQASRATRGLYGPQLSGAADLRYNAILPTNIIPNFANPASGERLAVRFGTKWQSSAGLTLNQRIYDAGALAQRRTDAVSEQLAANAALRGRVALVQDVSRAYYEALLRETQLGFARADSVRTQAVYQDLAARQRAGRALATDVATARINRTNATLALDLARQNVVLSKQNLLATLGTDATQAATLRLTDPLASLLTATADTAAWTASPAPAAADVAARRPEYQQEQLNAELALAAEQTERRGARPTLGVVGFLGAQGFDDKLTSALNVPNWYGNSYVALQAALPLLDGSARATRVETQRLRAEQARNRQADLQQTIRYEAANARVQLQNAWRTVAVRRQNVAVAAESAGLVRLRQQAGRALPREALDAEATQQQAQRDYLQAVYDFLTARLEYARVTGTLTE